MAALLERLRVSLHIDSLAAHWPPQWWPRIHQNLLRRIAGLLIGIPGALFMNFADTDLTGQQQRLLALIICIVTFWVFRVLPIAVTALLALALAVLLNIAPSQTVFGAFSSPVLFLLIGGFIIAQSMVKHGLGRRIALGVLSMPGVYGSTDRIIIVFGALAALLSTVLDNGAVAAMLLPIAVGLIQALSDDVRKTLPNLHDGSPLKFGTALMLITAYGSTVGALLTPLGDASNLVGWNFIHSTFDVDISIGTWILLSGPIVIVLFAVLATLVLVMNRPELRHIPNARAELRAHRHELGKMSRGELNTAIIFVLAVVFWLLPAAVGIALGHESPLHEYLATRIRPPVVAVIAAALLFLLPADETGHGTLRWRDVSRVDWGPVFLVGSGVALGKLMATTGLATVMGETLAAQAHGIGPFGVYLFAGATAIMFSELTSNLVSISVLVPIIPTLAVAGGGSPLEASLIATFAAIYGFMLPISTSANAIVYGSGHIPFSRMLKTGLLVDLSGIFIVVGGVHLMVHLLGLV